MGLFGDKTQDQGSGTGIDRRGLALTGLTTITLFRRPLTLIE
jgi:hypothetical protein